MNCRTFLLSLILTNLIAIQTSVFSQALSNLIPNNNSHIKSAFPSADVKAVESRHDVIIVGGGWSGFTAAYYLKDYDVEVLEPNSNPGWSVWTEMYDTFPYESEAAEQEKSPLSEMIDVLDLKIRKIPSPLEAYFHNNQLYYGPTGLADLLIAQSSESEFNRFASLLQTVMDQYQDLPFFDALSPTATLDNISAERWLKDNQFSQAYLDRFNVISRRYFGSNLSEVSALSLLAKIGKQYADEANAHALADAYATPKAIANYFGNMIQSDVDAIKVTKFGSRYTVAYEDKAKQRHVDTARVVILTTEPWDAIQLASNALSQEQIETLQSIPYRPEITVQIYSAIPIFDRAFQFSPPDHFVYTALLDDQWVDRKTDPNYSTEMNSATFILSPQSNLDTDFLDTGNYETAEEMYTQFVLPLVNGLSPFFPSVQEIGPQGVMGYVTYYKSAVEPIMTVGAYHRLQQLHDSVQNGLIPAGDYMVYPGFEGKVNSGYWAAQKAREFLGQASGIGEYEGYR